MKALHNYKTEAKRLVAEKRKARSVSAPHKTPETPKAEADFEDDEELYPGEEQEESPLDKEFESSTGKEAPIITVRLSKRSADIPESKSNDSYPKSEVFKRGRGRPRKG